MKVDAKKLFRRVYSTPYRWWAWIQSHLNPDRPWLVASAVKFLDGHLNPNMSGFEWGSGRSTLYFSKRLASLVTIEHDREWYQTIRSKIELDPKSNVKIQLVTAQENSFVENRNRPEEWKKLGYRPRKPHFSDYFDAILNYQDESFDFILVDGRARVACILNSISKLKPGGLLVLDNSDREEYSIVFPLLCDWKGYHFRDGLSETRVWLKPAIPG